MDERALSIFILADHLLSRAGLSALLETQAGALIVGQASLNAQEPDAILAAEPDILLVDLGWTPAQALQQVPSLEELGLPLLALLSDVNDAQDAITALTLFPAYGLIAQEPTPTLLLSALEAVNAGLIVLDPTLSEALITSNATPLNTLEAELTPREHEVLQWLARGLTNKGIAAQLGITEHTVKFHVNALLNKLGAQSRTEAVVRATQSGLIIL